MCQVMHGSGFCDKCGENFNSVVLISTGFDVIGLCPSCAILVTTQIMDSVVEIKSRGLEEKNNG